jgi:GntR family transcriptional regulator
MVERPGATAVGEVIEFRIESQSGVAPYRQIVQQVRQALRLGVVSVGDQLPTVKEVVAHVAINPNTVLKAYRELEHEGLVEGRPGLGTFVTRTLGGAPLATQSLRPGLVRWLARARAAGLDDDSIVALFEVTLRADASEGVA